VEKPRETSRVRPQTLAIGHWMVVCAALALGLVAFLSRGRPLRPGDTLRERLTLVTADRDELSCGSDDSANGLSCRYTSDGSERANPQAYAQTLVPYMTMHNQMFAIPGLFDDPALKRRFEQERPHGRKRADLRRFDASCQLELIHQMVLRPRWSPSGAFSGPATAWVARASACTVNR